MSVSVCAHARQLLSRPKLALTLLQLFLVVRFWLGGHDLKEGLENTPQVAGIVGLQLVSHTWRRGQGRAGVLASSGAGAARR